MAVFEVTSADGTVLGTAGNDLYLIDPDRVGDVVIRDLGGTDRIVLVGPGYEPAIDSLSVVRGVLVLDTVASGTVRFLLGPGERGAVEGLQLGYEPGAPPAPLIPLVLPGEVAPRGPAIFGGTAGDDRIVIPERSAVEGQTTTAFGGAGADTLVWTRGDHAEMHGGAGDDRLLSRGDAADLFGGAGDDLLRDDGVRDVFGGPGSRLFGGAGDDHLMGGVGGGVLSGGTGHDVLVSRGGPTTLGGGTGNDQLVGGGGRDAFIFEAGSGRGQGQDTVAGWTEADAIWLRGVQEDQVILRHRGADTVIAYLDVGRITVEGAHLDREDLVFG